MFVFSQDVLCAGKFSIGPVGAVNKLINYHKKTDHHRFIPKNTKL